MSESSHAAANPVELLAPAGDWQCVRAAVENGADAIYFGLDCGFNARHRARNFGVDDLADLSKHLRRRGVRAYVTLNTLVFPEEMEPLVPVIEQIARAGIDAVLVQDFGVARLVKTICPELEVHASTQMSLTSAETIRVAAQLGLSRVVLARELSVEEIKSIAASTEMPLEVFIHGALCVAYSGQCLTSESLGGRSANRGQCAQACRLPYELICDGEDHDLGDVRYLLSPQDLAGYDSIGNLVRAGVASFKIEGRLKSPEYVANITNQYRRAIDQAIARQPVTIDAADRREMELSFSRGLSPGWLEGNDHKRLVPGLDSAKRGIELGRLIDSQRQQIQVRLAAPVALGDGLAIRGRSGDGDQGGRVYSLQDATGNPQKKIESGQLAWIGFGSGSIDWNRITCDAMVFKNDDPRLNRRLRKSFTGDDPVSRQRIDMKVTAATGRPLVVVGCFGGFEVEVRGTDPLVAARNRPVTEEVLREKLSRLGGTPFTLGRLQVMIEAKPMVPLGLLNQLRRELVEKLLQQIEQPPIRSIDLDAGQDFIKPIAGRPEDANKEATPRLAVLCRNLEQVEASCQGQADLIYADFHDIRQYGDAVTIARERKIPIGLASVRIQKPSEMGLLRVLLRHEPDWILARNLAALAFCKEKSVPAIADFSLNVSNHRSAQWVRSVGAERVTASYDLNREQIFGLIDSVPPSWLEVVLHQHMPMFHMEHCVFCSVLSPGTNKTNCGRPCDRHTVELRDRVGSEHTLQADVACRNTLYNAVPQSGAEITGDLKDRGVGWYRIELLNQNDEQTRHALALYRQLLSDSITAREVWRSLQATNRLGVTRGTLESKRNPLAIL